ncbi:MAG: hypothetical protein U0792_08115 [Gemmataceae bacterium]
MALNRITCPECGAGMKSAAGFKVGKKVTCPKCEESFVVEEPQDEDEPEEEETPRSAKAKAPPSKATKRAARDDDDDEEPEEEEEERPKKKKKKKRRNDEEWSYRNSWIRYAILTVLIIIMCVLGYMLHLKRERERSSLDRGPQILHIPS